jgi:U3 small nucleolar RNA-associated protein 6
VPSATMFDLYTKFLIDAINKNGGGKVSEHFSNFGDIVDPISQLLIVYEKAESMGCISEDLSCQHVSFLLQLGRLDEAKILVEKLCTNMFSDSIQLWALWLSIELRCIQDRTHSPSKANLSSFFDLLRNVLNKVAISEAESLWHMVRINCSQEAKSQILQLHLFGY